MALPSQKEVQALVDNLIQASQAYCDAPDLNGYMSRAQILSKARELTQALTTPDQKPNYHGLNVGLYTISRLTRITRICQVGRLLVASMPQCSLLTPCFTDGRAHCHQDLYQAQGS